MRLTIRGVLKSISKSISLFNNQRRQIKIILPPPASGVARSVQQIEYDSLGRVAKTIDPLGNVSQIVYNELGQVTKQIDANGGETKYMYNNLGQLLSLTDPVGNTTSYEYDSQRHVVKETNALEKSRYFEYLGQLLTRKIDRNGRVIEYVYDRFGRQKEEHWLEGKTIIKTIVNTYNETGNLIGVNDGLNSFEYEFNSLRLETQSIVRFDGLNKEIKLKSVYDRRGQKTDTEPSYL
ncbi:MAG: hypothetical protein LBE12_12620 [Planctomycetaceae bacterium]|jgi:YD repeat-containing protein|nr:hypothetical protein [Planctomycetaceae bacterium]